MSTTTPANFWDSPCEAWHSSLVPGTVEWSEQIRRWRYTVQPHIPRALAKVCSFGDRVLEVGCGIGTDGLEIARTVPHYRGYDTSEQSVNLAEKRRITMGVHNATFYLGNKQNGYLDGFLSVKGENSFDAVYYFGVHHHVASENQPQMLQNIFSLLRPGGGLVMMVYATNSWKAAMIRNGMDQFEANKDCPIARTYTKEEIRQELHAAGFVDVQTEQQHIFPYDIPSYKEHKLVRKEYFARMPYPVFHTLEKEFGWHLMVYAQKPA